MSVVLRAVAVGWDHLIVAAAEPAREPHQPLPVSPACRRGSDAVSPAGGQVARVGEGVRGRLTGVEAPTRKRGAVLAEVAAGLRARGLG